MYARTCIKHAKQSLKIILPFIIDLNNCLLSILKQHESVNTILFVEKCLDFSSISY